MTGRPTHTLFLVPSANHAVQGEAALARAGVACRLIPVPRRLSSQCGVCLSVSVAERRRAEEALLAAGTVTEGVHDVWMPGEGQTDPGSGDCGVGNTDEARETDHTRQTGDARETDGARQTDGARDAGRAAEE